MTIKQAIKKITSEWEKLQALQNKGFSSLPKTPAVWCAKSDTAGSYEVDEEWIGISPQGNIIWAYASGCSCWGGDFSEERYASMKEVTLSHTQHTPEAWEEMIIKFAEAGTGEILSFT